MKQTKKQTRFHATSRRISLALVSLFLLGSFLLSMFVVPTSVSAQGQQCLRSNWNFLFDWKTVTVDSITGIGSSITTTGETMQVEVFITPSDSSDIVYWGNKDDRQYSLEATRSGGGGSETVAVSAISPGGTGQLRLLFNLPGSTFTQLVNDQQTGYALTLKSPGRGDCFVASYTATREDNELPPVSCEPRTENQCGATAGCGTNETCIMVGAKFECQKIPGSCKHLSCGTIGNPTNGDTCGCAGSQFAQMGAGNYCCGYIANGTCVATFPANCGSELYITGKEGVGTTLPESTQSHRVYATYQFKNQDFDSYFLSIATTGSTGVESFSTTAVNSGEVNAYTRSVSFNLTDRKFFQALPPEAGATKSYGVGLYGSRGGTHSLMCILGEYEISSDEENPNPQTCTRSNWGKCGAAGGCSKDTETCVEGGCREIDKSCRYSAPSANPPANPDPADPADSSSETPGETSPSDEGSLLDAIKGPTNKTFDALNPLNISAGLKGESTKSPYLRSFATPGGVVSRLLLFAFPIAGIILFLMIVWGGFEMVTGAANAKSMDAGKQRITAAVIGFILLFVSYWLMQLIELIFGLSIL